MIKKLTCPDGIQLHVEIETPEKPNGKLVFILTGDGKKGSKSGTWTRLIPELLKDGVEVVSFDFYSLGQSEGDYAQLSLSMGIKNFLCVLNSINTDGKKIGIVAASFGGAVALNALCQELFSPDFMVLKSAAFCLFEGYEHEQGNIDNMVIWKETGISPVTQQSYEVYLDSLQYSCYSKISSIKCPTLVIHGTKDSVIPVQQSLRLCSLNHRFLLSLIDGADHDYKQNNALDIFIQQTRDFIKNQN